MLLASHRRMVAALVLAALFLWNVPAMALPSLLPQAADCYAPKPAEVAAPERDHAHQHGIEHAMPAHAAATLRPANLGLDVRQCVTEHTCCSFDREPERKSEPYALDAERAQAQRIASALPQHSAAPEVAGATPHRRAVFDLKADLRI